MYSFERRYFDRFKIPEAKVEFSIKNNNPINAKLIDISKISVSFEYDKEIYEGDYLELNISIPGREDIYVKGHVIRIEKSAIPCIVIQFLPFGTNEEYNSMEAYKKLSRLTESFSLQADTIMSYEKF